MGFIWQKRELEITGIKIMNIRRRKNKKAGEILNIGRILTGRNNAARNHLAKQFIKKTIKRIFLLFFVLFAILVVLIIYVVPTIP